MFVLALQIYENSPLDLAAFFILSPKNSWKFSLFRFSVCST